MKKVLVFLVIALLYASTAYCGGFAAIKGWFTWTAAAFILSGLLALGAVGKYTPWLSKLFIAFGSFFTGMGLALADGKVSGDELKAAKNNLVVIKNLLKGKKDG